MGSKGEMIEIRGARTHNLRNIDLTVPHGRLTVFTGVSGSGKSSLALDTIFAEGQRRYVECLSPYVRRYLDQIQRPDVDAIDGLPPTLSVSQWVHPLGGTPRSTVATMTEIHDYLRLLYARCGDFHCPKCGREVGTQSLEQILDATLSLPDGERIYILAPLVHGRKGKHPDQFRFILREGFLRARLDGAITMVDGPRDDLDPDIPHDIEMVVDRQVVREGLRDRLAESVQSALKHGNGSLIITYLNEEGEWVDRLFSTRYACPDCGESYREPQPRSFSFNSPYGACPTCEGLGKVLDFDPQSVIPDRTKSLAGGALAPFRTSSGTIVAKLKKQLSAFMTPSQLQCPYGELDSELQQALWSGNDVFPGVWQLLKKEGEQKDEAEVDPVATYRMELPCPDCGGARLNAVGRSVTVGGLALHQFLALPIEKGAVELGRWRFRDELQSVAEPLLADLCNRFDFLVRAGVGYVELDRPVGSLSGGEAQRIRLAGCVGAGLNGVCYVLDEPTIGLHARDTNRLLELLEELRDKGNTVLVVEHDESAIRRADWIVDLGPQAGRQGGKIINQGAPVDFVRGPGLTAQYLNRREKSTQETGSSPDSSPAGQLVLTGIRHHNLANVDFLLPLQRLVCVTGVSGSGKSSLVIDVLVPALKNALANKVTTGRHFDVLAGWEPIQDLTVVDQGPIGRSPRSCPATYSGLIDAIRNVFAKTRESKVRGYSASRFGFNTKEGQCPECQGIGARKLEMTFMPDTYVSCKSCRGKRYNTATLNIRYRGMSIGDVLEMTVDQAGAFFENHSAINGICRTLSDVGLGYLQLGQWATTLSGGEAQRLKLASKLAKPKLLPTLFVLDEPTTGLHFHDVQQLIMLLRRLVASGHTVLVIEHHLDLISQADWVIDLGPEGGAAGGQVIAQGPPSLIATNPASVTGLALRKEGIRD